MNIAQRPETESVPGTGVDVAIHHHGLAAARHLEDLAHLGVQLEVGDAAPELRHGQLTHGHRGLLRPHCPAHPATARAPDSALSTHPSVLPVAEGGAGGE